MSVMSARQSMKITTNGKDFKKINNAPESYSDLVRIAIEKLGGNVKDNIQISFIDLSTKVEVRNQKEYNELKNTGVPIKIQVCLKERKQESLNDLNNINNINDINEVGPNDKALQEQQVQKQTQMSLEEDYKNKLKESLTSIITSKLQTMKLELIHELSANVNNIMPTSMSQQQSLNNNMSLSQNITHKGITCSNCKAGDIKGIRYKCTSCSNYNLCDTCEGLNVHDIRHIFIKIRLPINDNELPQSKLTYAFENANTSYNFLLINTNTALSAPNGAETLTTQVQIKNTGASSWSSAFSFKCFENESSIIGFANKLQNEVPSYDSVTLSLTFNTKSKEQGTYNSLWRMYDNNGVAFGSTVSFTITIDSN